MFHSQVETERLREELEVTLREMFFQQNQKSKMLEDANSRIARIAKDVQLILAKLKKITDPDYLPLFKENSDSSTE